MSVAVVSETLEGFVIKGNNEKEYIKLMKSCTELESLLFNKSMLKSPSK